MEKQELLDLIEQHKDLISDTYILKKDYDNAIIEREDNIKSLTEQLNNVSRDLKTHKVNNIFKDYHILDNQYDNLKKILGDLDDEALIKELNENESLSIFKKQVQAPNQNKEQSFNDVLENANEQSNNSDNVVSDLYNTNISY